MSARERLPDRRATETVRFIWPTPSGAQIKIIATLGFYDCAMSKLGEIFLNTKRTGTEMEILLKDTAILASLAMQYGCPIDVMRRALLRKPDGAGEGPLGALFDRMARERAFG